MNVSAIDKATSKTQEIRISSGSGLSEEEIEKMTRDAEENRESDKKKREVIDTKNQLDAMILASEKMIKEGGEKLSDGSKKELEAAITEAKKHLEAEELTVLKSAMEALQNVSHKVATEMYQQAGGPQSGPGGPEQAQEKEGEANNSTQKDKKDEDVVDADYKEV